MSDPFQYFLPWLFPRLLGGVYLQPDGPAKDAEHAKQFVLRPLGGLL
jgi:hypothetical protein